MLFLQSIEKLQNPTRQTKNRYTYIEGGEDWDEFITWGRDWTRIFFEISTKRLCRHIGMRFTFKKTVGGVANPTPACKSISFWFLIYLSRWNKIQTYNKMHVNWSTLFEILVLPVIPSCYKKNNCLISHNCHVSKQKLAYKWEIETLKSLSCHHLNALSNSNIFVSLSFSKLRHW